MKAVRRHRGDANSLQNHFVTQHVLQLNAHKRLKKLTGINDVMAATVTATTLTKKRYRRLLADLKKILERSRTRTREVLQKELIQVYWSVGRRITKEKLTEAAAYGDSVLEDAAEELGVEYSTLTRAIGFYNAYKKVAPRGKNLTWSHYRELIAVKDEPARLFYEKQAEKNVWQRDRLRKAIQEGLFEKQEKSKSTGGANAARARRKRLRLKRPVEPTYVYKAKVERVIDGDTLLLRIDLGFQVWKEQRVRLADVDAAPLASTSGTKAFEFVRLVMAKAATIVVKTNKIDVYGRYVGHVFYTKKPDSLANVFLKGIYLNQKLLNEGLAKPA